MTLPGYTVVEWADKVGRGFAPFRPPDNPAGTEFWLAAQALLEADIVAQPPVKSTAPHPVWSLRYVEVKRLGGRWCFVVQGRGGPFGVAGTCRFSFAPADAHPFDVWEASVADECDDPPPAEPPASDVVLRVLESVLLNAPRVRVPGSPTDVALVIGRVLRALPRGIAARRDWSTCLLQRPDVQRPVVTGDLPEEYRAAVPGVARSLDQIRWSPAPAPQAVRAAVGRHQRALEWLLDQTTSDRPDDLPLHSDATDAATLLGEITRTRLELTLDDVPRLLRGTDVKRLRGALNLVAAWARNRPGDALNLMPRISDPDLRHAAIEGLVQAQPADNPGWHLRLDTQTATLLREFAPDPDALAAHLRDMRSMNRAFARALDSGPARTWLVGLGMSPWTHPDLFPDRAAVLAETIDGDPREWPAVEHELGSTNDPDLAVAVARRLRTARPELAAQLMMATAAVWPPATGSRRQARDLADALMKKAPARGVREAEQWLATMLRHLRASARAGDPDTVATLREAMYGGLLALPARRIRLQHLEPALVHECERIGVKSDAPERVRRMLAKVVEPPARPSSVPSGATIYVSNRSGASYQTPLTTGRPVSAPEHTEPRHGVDDETFLQRNGAKYLFLGVVVAALVMVAVLIPKLLEPSTITPSDNDRSVSATAEPANSQPTTTGSAPGSASASSVSPPDGVTIPPNRPFLVERLAGTGLQSERALADVISRWLPTQTGDRHVRRLVVTIYLDNLDGGKELAVRIGRLVKDLSPPGVDERTEVLGEAERTRVAGDDGKVTVVATTTAG